MNRQEDVGERLDHAFWEVNAAASGLVSYGCSVSARYLQDRRLRMQFNRELAYYARRVVSDVYERKISPEEGLQELESESRNIRKDGYRIFTQTIGAIGGAGQMLAGGGICYGSAGTLCAFVGAPLIAHGTNNFYENARGLFEARDDVEGPVRKAYQTVAEAVGYSEREGNLAYLGSDLVLSVSALLRAVPRADAWRLFKYYRMDKEAAIRQMGGGALFIEMGVNSSTGYQLYEEYKK